MVVAIDKRSDGNQVTMPPEGSVDGDLANCGCYEVDCTSSALRAPRSVAVQSQDCGGSRCQSDVGTA